LFGGVKEVRRVPPEEKTKKKEVKRVPKEREFEIGKDESWAANMKRLFDETLNLSLESTARNRTIIDKLISDAQSTTIARDSITTQCLQNAVETANLAGKAALRHADLAVDRQWNVDEIAQLVAKTPVFLDAISAAVAAAVNESMKK